MTREEKELALYCLKASSDYHSEVCEECIKYPNCDHTGQDDVTETIIEALEQEPSIDMEEIKEIMECDADAETKCKMISSIVNGKPHYFTEQKPKTGHWLRTGEVDVYYDLPSYECSKCGKTSLENGDYCPNCGARMESEEQA